MKNNREMTKEELEELEELEEIAYEKTLPIGLYDLVRIKSNNELAYVVFHDEDSYLLETINKGEFPKFYKEGDFDLVEKHVWSV